MSNYLEKASIVGSSLVRMSNAPLDAKYAVSNIEERNKLVENNLDYEGMLVYIQDDIADGDIKLIKSGEKINELGRPNELYIRNAIPKDAVTNPEDLWVSVFDYLALDENVVHISGDEVISGLKDFSTNPTVNKDPIATHSFVNEQSLYTDESENGSTVALGGIPKGKKYTKTPLTQVIDDLLHPYVAPTGVSISMNIGGGTFEFGVTKTVSSGTVRWTNGSKKVLRAEIISSNTVKGTTEISTVVNNAAVTLTAPITIKTNTSFQGRINDGTANYTGGNVSYNFVYPYYYGVITDNSTIDSAVVTKLTKQVVGKGNKTYSFTSNNQFIVMAYPASYGNLRSILDPNKFENINGFTKKVVAVIGLDGTAQNYHVYVANSRSNVSAYALTFNY